MYLMYAANYLKDEANTCNNTPSPPNLLYSTVYNVNNIKIMQNYSCELVLSVYFEQGRNFFVYQ